jgi:hypothetical protein
MPVKPDLDMHLHAQPIIRVGQLRRRSIPAFALMETQSLECKATSCHRSWRYRGSVRHCGAVLLSRHRGATDDSLVRTGWRVPLVRLVPHRRRYGWLSPLALAQYRSGRASNYCASLLLPSLPWCKTRLRCHGAFPARRYCLEFSWQRWAIRGVLLAAKLTSCSRRAASPPLNSSVWPHEYASTCVCRF